MSNTARDHRHPHSHAAKFYESEDSLCTTVAGFLAEGLTVRQPALVIATPLHVAAIELRLAQHDVDVARARRVGDLVVLDAEDTLGAFMVGDHPDVELFEANVGMVMDQIIRGRRGSVLIRAYGEMVDVLWKEGRTVAAIELEILWNKLALKHAFSLLCGYSMGNFLKQAEQFHEVCRQHTHVFDHAATVATFDRRAPGFA